MAEKTRDKAKAESDERDVKKREKLAKEHVEEREQVEAATDDDAEGGEDSDEEDEASDESDGEPDGAEEDEAPVGERDESTKGVARALGVDVDEETGTEEDAEEKAKPNRAERRREEALRRRAAREGTATATATKAVAKKSVEADDAPAEEKLPKDKNARAKELLRRRQESASGKRVSKLDTGEMVQDSLARAGSATGKWLREHLGMVVGVLLVGVGGTVGFMLWTNHKEAVIASASDDLEKGLRASRGYIFVKADTRPDTIKKADPSVAFASLDARADAQLAAYKTVVDKHGGTGAAILAQLGEATAYLDKSKWDDAISAYNAVLATALATADADVKGRALEGLGFAKEGKGDFDGATAAFKDLEAVNAKGFDDLGKYHQARILLKKGDTDQAKEVLVALRKKLEVPTVEGTESQYVKTAVNDYLRGIDPALAPKPPAVGGLRGTSFSPEDLQNLDEATLRKLIEQQAHQEGESGLPPIPGAPPNPGAPQGPPGAP